MAKNYLDYTDKLWRRACVPPMGGVALSGLVSMLILLVFMFVADRALNVGQINGLPCLVGIVVDDIVGTICLFLLTYQQGRRSLILLLSYFIIMIPVLIIESVFVSIGLLHYLL